MLSGLVQHLFDLYKFLRTLCKFTNGTAPDKFRLFRRPVCQFMNRLVGLADL